MDVKTAESPKVITKQFHILGMTGNLISIINRLSHAHSKSKKFLVHQAPAYVAQDYIFFLDILYLISR